jgi:hypothetical protein
MGVDSGSGSRLTIARGWDLNHKRLIPLKALGWRWFMVCLWLWLGEDQHVKEGQHG